MGCGWEIYQISELLNYGHCRNMVNTCQSLIECVIDIKGEC